MKALLLTISKLIVGSQNDIQEAREVFFGKQCCNGSYLLFLIRRNLQQRRLSAGALRHYSVAQEATQLLGKMGWALPFGHQPIKQLQQILARIAVNTF